MQIQQVHGEDVLALDWSADSNYIASGDSKGHLQVYDVRKMTQGIVEPTWSFVQAISDPKAVLTVCWNPLRPVRSTTALLLWTTSVRRTAPGVLYAN